MNVAIRLKMAIFLRCAFTVTTHLQAIWHAVIWKWRQLRYVDVSYLSTASD